MPTQPRPPVRRFRLHHVYFALAAFDVLAVCSGLYLSHRFMTIYTDSVSVNQRLAAHLKDFAKLGDLAQVANAPGNDVFDSHDVPLETKRRDEALKAFNTHLGTMRTVLVGESPLLKDALGKVEVAMGEMLAEADLIFKFFANNEPDKAGERMATMDRKYGLLTRQVNEATEIIRGIQDTYLFAQLDLAADLRQYEYLIGAAIFFMVAFVTVYGHKIGQVMKKAEDEAGEHITQLETSSQMVKDLNAELIQNIGRVKEAEVENIRTARQFSEEQNALIRTLGISLDQLARGDLTVFLEARDSDPFRQIKTDFNTTVRHLHNTLGVIATATREVAGEAKSIAAVANELAAQTERQVSTLEETSTSMEEVAAAVNNNAQGAQRATQVAEVTLVQAVNGGRVASQAVAAMDQIEHSTARINEIVGVVEEVAFQTNILALNAAVEAARAGEAGKGFAVVAGEVRSLSQRTGQALKDIKVLISKAHTDVHDGVGLVRQAGSALTEIVKSTKLTVGLISDIAASSREQASGVAQVSRTVLNMNEMTQQNAQLVEETNAALHAAQLQIEALRRSASIFSTSNTRSSSTRDSAA